MRKKILPEVVVFCVVLALVITACAPAATQAPPQPTQPPAQPTQAPAPTEAPTEVPPPEAIQLTFWHEWDETNNPQAFAWVQEVVQAYQAANPNVKVDALAIPDQQYNTKFQTAVASQTTPDGFMVRPGGWFKVYIDEGVVIPLDDYLAEGGWGESFMESALAVCQYGGQTYCLPGGIRSVQVWYNAALFKELGIVPPTTWEELEAVANTLKENDVIPFALANKEGWEAPLIYEYLLIRLGGYEAFVSASSRDGKAKFNDPVFVAAAQKLADMQAAGWFPEGANGLEFGDMLGQFFNGDAAMAVFLNVMPGIASGMAPEGFELAYFEFPAIGDTPADGLVGSIGGAWAISSASPHPDQMADFLRFWTSKENMAKLSSAAEWVMSVKDTVSKETASELQWSFYTEISNAAYIIPFLDYALTPDTSAQIFESLQQILDGSLDPQAAMDLWEQVAVEDYGK